MADPEVLPRLFGPYLLTEKVGTDALGRVYRARKAEDPAVFFSVRILEAPGLDYDGVLTAIEQYGSVHDFLKNPAIAREVEMDSVEGDPFIAYRDPGGRTLDLLLSVAQTRPFPIPAEHSLLIAEKIATGLDHAYNTLIDGERTLHGLVWPGFVEISDDGETRLFGFGLAEGILASRTTPAVRDLLSPYLAPEVRVSGIPSKVGDVYSNGAVLLNLLTGHTPPLQGAADSVAGSKLSGQGEPIPADIAAVLKTAVAESAEARYETAGALRRELGKLLFSGRYSPSTFNLAFFLTNLFKDQIAQEQSKRDRESAFDALRFPRHTALERPPRQVAPPRFGARPFEPEEPAEKKPFPKGILIGALAAVAVVAGGLIAFLGKPAPKPAPPPRPAPPPVSAAPPPPPVQPTGGMTPEQYKEEVARRVAEEMKKLDAEQRIRLQKETAARIAALKPQPTAVAPRVEAPRPLPLTPSPASSTAPTPSTPPPASPSTAESRPAPPPSAPVPTVKRGDLVDISEVDSPPQIAGVIKPQYPPIARRMNVSGTVILSVLVTETGKVSQVRVLREAGGKMGLTEAASEAVKRWSFKPAMKDGVAVKTWFTVPIPFVL
jgi:TonB family protein